MIRSVRITALYCVLSAECAGFGKECSQFLRRSYSMSNLIADSGANTFFKILVIPPGPRLSSPATSLAPARLWDQPCSQPEAERSRGLGPRPRSIPGPSPTYVHALPACLQSLLPTRQPHSLTCSSASPNDPNGG